MYNFQQTLVNSLFGYVESERRAKMLARDQPIYVGASELIIFISHSGKNSEVYEEFCEKLDLKGIARWSVDSMDPGQSLAGQLQSAVLRSDICVFLATRDSLSSMWCLTELGAFWGAGKRVIVYISEPGLGPEDLPPQFREHLYTSNVKRMIETIEKERKRRQITRSYSMDYNSRFLKYYLRGIKESYYRHLRDIRSKFIRQIKVRVNIMKPIPIDGNSDDIIKIAYCDYYNDFTPAEKSDDWHSGEGKCGMAWQSGEQTLYAEDIDSKDSKLEEMHAASRTAKALKSVLSTPIFFEGSPIAILNLDSRLGCEKTQFHKEFCSMLCREAAEELAPVLANVFKNQ